MFFKFSSSSLESLYLRVVIVSLSITFIFLSLTRQSTSFMSWTKLSYIFSLTYPGPKMVSKFFVTTFATHVITRSTDLFNSFHDTCFNVIEKASGILTMSIFLDSDF